MNDEPQNIFDDELLSAYLDDELSAEERAVVEARLEADPAARQLLEQLRAASQAVQRMPQEALGRDLREAVLQRVANVGAPSPCPLPKGEGERRANGEPAMPRITIGRTTRGWVWAAFAVAAALLLMFVQSDDTRNNKLPAVAQRDSGGAKVAVDDRLNRRQLRNEPMVSAAPETPAPAAAATSEEFYNKLPQDAEVAATAAPREPAGDAIDGQPQGAPLAQIDSAKEKFGGLGGGSGRTAGEAEAPRQSNVEDLADAKLGFTRRAESVGGEIQELPGAAGAPPSSAAAKEESAEEEDSLVVVHVVAKRAAMQNKSFDQLLASSGVFFDTDTADVADKPATEPAGRFAKQRRPERTLDEAEKAGEPQSGAGDGVDVVMVEAPPSVIASCVAKLSADHDNYVGVDVDESPAADKSLRDQSAAAKIMPAKNLVTDLGKYRRGVVTQQQKELVAGDARRFDVFHESHRDRGRFEGGPGLDGEPVAGSAVRLDARGGEMLDRKDKVAQNVGRARRLLVRESEGLRQGEPSKEGLGVGGAAAIERSQLQTELKRSVVSGVENVKVLFYFSPDDAVAPSPAVENPSR